MEIKQPAELSHVLTMTHRNLLKMWHNPDNVEGQGKILLALADEDHLSQKQLASRLGMSPQSTSEFVYKLVNRQLVTLSKSTKDRRVNLVNLTAAGRKEIASAAQEV
ncbi:hypothetical protein WP50_19290, partial [Lactiplantibacillus plantarum]